MIKILFIFLSATAAATNGLTKPGRRRTFRGKSRRFVPAMLFAYYRFTTIGQRKAGFQNVMYGLR